MSEIVEGRLGRRRRLAGLLKWYRDLWARYWRDLAEVGMLASFVGAGFWLHPVAGLVVLGLSLLYVVYLTGKPVEKDGDDDASAR